MKNILIFFFIFKITITQAQNVSLDWVNTYGGNLSENAKTIRTDSQGNLFITGIFRDTVDFDPGPGIENRWSNGGNDVYILKLNSIGNFLWVKTFGNASNDVADEAQIDKMNNIIITGHFQNSVDFDPSMNVDLKISNGSFDAYIMKLDNAGNYLWTKTIGGSGTDLSNGLSINSSNDITVAGVFQNSVDFDPGPALENKNALMVDIYILQLTANGNFNWVKTLVGPQISSMQMNDIMFDKNDNLLMNATFRDSIDVDPGPNIQYLIDTVGPLHYNLFILKLDKYGNYIWAKQFNNTSGNSVGISVLSCDSVGHYYLGGLFTGNIDFDFSAASYNIAVPKTAAYILKIDSNANFIWAKNMGGFSGISPELEGVWGIAIDIQSNVFLCGSFKGYEDFDPGPGSYYLGNPNLIENLQGFIMQLNNMGNFGWAKQIGEGISSVSVNSILINSQDEIYVAGYFSDTTDFDFNAGVNNVISQGILDAFALKIKYCVNNGTVDSINSCTPITWIDGNTYSTNNFTATFTFNNVSGCDSIVTLNLTISTIDTTINKTANTLTANATGVTYQWINCSNSFLPIVGETNQSFTPTSNGSYAVVMSNGFCSDTSNCYTFNTLALDKIVENQISLLPNPSHGQVFIQSNKQLALKLYNAVGELVISKEINNKNSTSVIDLSEVPKGLYLYELIDKLQVISRAKLILE